MQNSDDEKKNVDAKSPQKRAVFRAYAASRQFVAEIRAYNEWLPTAFLLGVLLALVWYVTLAPPQDFVAPNIIKITSGETLGEAATQLEAAHVIRSATLFKFMLRAVGDNTGVKAGSYFFPAPQNAITVAVRLVDGDFELTPVRVTIGEGETARQIGIMLAQKLAPFDETTFLQVATPREGYLYPDTYYFLPGEDPAQVALSLEEDFQNHIATIQPQISAFNQSENDDVTMASILVGEAATDNDRRIVAGILWKRIKLGMPLQVDAPFGYVLNKPLTELTGADLKIDSPYNTYINKGLPPTPIGSPGVEAILQAVTPIKTNYLYYLSDKNGVMHYAATYAGQEANIRRYYGT